MAFKNDRDFERALERVSALLERPLHIGTPEDEELDRLLLELAEHQQVVPPPELQGVLSKISQRADVLVRHAEQVRRTLKRHQGGEGFGGLPFDGQGMGPSTGA